MLVKGQTHHGNRYLLHIYSSANNKSVLAVCQHGFHRCLSFVLGENVILNVSVNESIIINIYFIINNR